VAQFLRHAGPEGVLDVQVDMAVSGSSTTQARASVLVGGVEVLTALGALGCRPFGAEGAWAHRPDVSPPDDLARLTFPPLGGGGIVDLIDVRPSPQAGRPATGRWAAWCRVVDAPAGAAVSVATLAVLADFSVLALGDVLGAPTIGNSVDNTLRVADRGAGDWVLLDVSVEAVHDGFGHLTTHLWGGDDRLLATASQTLILRDADAHGRAVRTTRRIVGAGTVE
jgi:acyl-CoA thioesterase